MKKAVTTDASGMFRIRIRKLQSVPAEIHIVPKAYPVLAEISEAVRLFVTEGEEYAKDRGGEIRPRCLTSRISAGSRIARFTGS